MRKKLLIVIGVLAVIGLGIAGFSLASNRPMPIQEEQETEIVEESASSEKQEETTPTDTEDFIRRYESHNLEKYTSGDQKKTFRFLQLNHDVEIHYVSYQDAIQMLQDGKQFALYYGWTTCSYCRSVLEPLCNAAVADNVPLYCIKVADGEENTSRSQYELQDGKAIKTYTNEDFDQFIAAYGEDAFLKYYVYEDTDEAHENGIDTGARQMYAPTLLFVKGRKAIRFSCTEWDQSITHSTGKDRENLQNKLQSFLVSGTCEE